MGEEAASFALLLFMFGVWCTIMIWIGPKDKDKKDDKDDRQSRD